MRPARKGVKIQSGWDAVVHLRALTEIRGVGQGGKGAREFHRNGTCGNAAEARRIAFDTIPPPAAARRRRSDGGGHEVSLPWGPLLPGLHLGGVALVLG